MHVIAEVLDNQLIDRSGKRMGRADGIIAIVRAGRPPCLAYLESGPLTLAARVHPRLQAWLSAWVVKFGLKHLQSFRIPWSKVLDVGIDIDIDMDAPQTPAFSVENWIRERIIKRIPWL